MGSGLVIIFMLSFRSFLRQAPLILALIDDRLVLVIYYLTLLLSLGHLLLSESHLGGTINCKSVQ
jgi:hypothetical protein